MKVEVLYSDNIIQHYYEVSHVWGDPVEFVEMFPPPDGGYRSRCTHAHGFAYGWTRKTRRCYACGLLQRGDYP